MGLTMNVPPDELVDLHDKVRHSKWKLAVAEFVFERMNAVCLAMLISIPLVWYFNNGKSALKMALVVFPVVYIAAVFLVRWKSARAKEATALRNTLAQAQQVGDICAQCGYIKLKAPRCPECGQ